ncbi:transglycosylase domain-containing protein [Pseudomonas sp. DC3000-4b1]|uniref:transglycosylase domain-containing protein n=1 Tax=unclassified Pseudomonas TaxID=196821 RepID=UPI003CF91A78
MGVLWKHDSEPRKASLDSADSSKSGSGQGRRTTIVFLALAALLIVAAAVAARWEMQNARLQATWLSRWAATLTYASGPGPSDHIVYPSAGPFDKRLGYSELDSYVSRLLERNYAVQRQMRFSPALMDYTERGLFVPYAEKPQAGLLIKDGTGAQVYRFDYPQQLYRSFEDIPPLVVDSLLFIENRHLLDPHPVTQNPAVDWPRFAKAAWSQLAHALGLPGQSAGGSTLATQLEKYRHSPDGLTASGLEKLRQMLSASVRAYQEGPNTLHARQRIVRDYLNSVPLSAVPGHGEVHGLAEGLRVWYGANFDRVNQALLGQDAQAKGMALRQVLSLMIAQRRPSHFLTRGHDELDELTAAHLRLLAGQKVIDQDLAKAALASRLRWRDWAKEPTWEPYANDKGVMVARSRLAGLLGVPLYDLDRLDLSATTSLDAQLQTQATAYLKRLADPVFAQAVGLLGERLLTPASTREVKYSFTLFENTPKGAQVRVQTDNTDQPFDINEGSKLELGSTAKLRVLTSYLEVINELYDRYAGRPAAELRKVQVDPQDRLTRWTLDYLLAHPGTELTAVLEAALERKYSANPGERFFTGGGLHTFHNFRREDDGRSPTLKEALRESINLPFVRLMRDLVRYSIYQAPNNSAELLKDDSNPQRQAYLARFADREGTEYLRRFWHKYAGKDTQVRVETFLDDLRVTPVRLAAVHRYLYPQADLATFERFVRQYWTRTPLSDKRLAQMYERYGPGAYDLPDQGYIARVHPLDLWLLGYLLQHPEAQWPQVVEASRFERQEVYGWLFKSRHKGARDSRIRTMVEIEAFSDVHRRWQRLGYPFDHLVPSLATALGSSGDRPASLAELMGVILNDGVRMPTVRIDDLLFGQGTPYETALITRTDGGERVLSSEVANAMRQALAQVVNAGTARRVAGSFTQGDGTPLAMGGKTGTGDNRIESFGSGGRLLGSRARNRTATFVFYLGDRHFGTLTAYVPGKASSQFTFTSALPVQVLKGMAPFLNPYLQRASAKPAPGEVAALSHARLLPSAFSPPRLDTPALDER